MAKIVITVDTYDKTFAATIDGVEVPNAITAYCYAPDSQGYGFGVSINTYEQVGDLRKYTSISASAQAEEEIKSGEAKASAKYKGFAEKNDLSPLQKSVAALISRNNKR